ncbi:MAG: GntR family transcriptional regulator [Rubellimicrobium sp.]|nr:GntR family transcriptional regulator [Rubellimicrobium sp.]
MSLHGSLSRYRLVGEAVRKAITLGELAPGARLPSEAELCQLHGVSRGTVVKAIEQLVAEGVVIRRQGLGTFVARPSLRRTAGGLASFTEAVGAQGHRAGQRLISWDQAPVDLANASGMTEPATRLVRLRLVDGLPGAIHVSLVPTALLDLLPEEERASLCAPGGSGFSLYRAFERIGCPVERAREQVSARLAREDEARLLDLDGPGALMVVMRSSYDARDRLIEVSEAVYLADRYGFDLELVRDSARTVPHRLASDRTTGQANLQQGIMS